MKRKVSYLIILLSFISLGTSVEAVNNNGASHQFKQHSRQVDCNKEGRNKSEKHKATNKKGQPKQTKSHRSQTNNKKKNNCNNTCQFK